VDFKDFAEIISCFSEDSEKEKAGKQASFM
jgi:hypothetical protein